MAADAALRLSINTTFLEILYTYYSQYKGFHDDIDKVLQQVEGLQGILESLRQIKERFEIADHEPSSQLHLALEACEATLRQLKYTADKCNNTKQAADTQGRIRNARKRLLWPYKKDTLSGMQAMLGRFQDNLSLALQDAGLNVMFQKLESLHLTLNNMENQTASIQNTLLHNTGELQALHRDATKATLIQHQHQGEIYGGLKILHAQALD